MAEEVEPLRDEQWEATSRRRHDEAVPFDDLTAQRRPQPSIGGGDANLAAAAAQSHQQRGGHGAVHELREPPALPKRAVGAMELREPPALPKLNRVPAASDRRTLHLAMRDGEEAAARRLARGRGLTRVPPPVRPRAAQEAAQAAADRKTRAAQETRQQCQTPCKKQTKVVVALGAACGPLAVLLSYFNGCGACENGAACDGLFGECVCTGNHLGEYCEDSCGDFGQVNRGGVCVCSGNRTGTLCELDALGQLVDDRDDSTGLGAGWIVLIVLGTCCFCVTCMPCALFEFSDDSECDDGDCIRPRFWDD